MLSLGLITGRCLRKDAAFSLSAEVVRLVSRSRSGRTREKEELNQGVIQVIVRQGGIVLILRSYISRRVFAMHSSVSVLSGNVLFLLLLLASNSTQFKAVQQETVIYTNSVTVSI